MMDTIKIENKKNTLVIGHRGCSGLQTENTVPAFLEGAKRTYYGLECDIHPTKDDVLVISHDSNLLRVTSTDRFIPDYTYKELMEVEYPDKQTNKIDKNIKIPKFIEYLDICKKYDKYAIVELKETIRCKDIDVIIDEVETHHSLEKTIFISFFPGLLVKLREKLPNQEIQFLVGNVDSSIFDFCIVHNLSIDSYFKGINKEWIDRYHDNGLKVNIWTVDNKDDALRFIDYGVDYITTNILE